MDVDALELERAWLRQLLDALATPVAVYAPDGHIEFANEARRRLTGPDVTTFDEAIARLQHAHEDGTPIPKAEHPATRALAGETVTGEQVRIRAADGRSLVMLANAAPLRNAKGDLIGAVIAYDDITELSDLERGRRELFGTANHDLRTPLTTILGSVQLARRQLGGSPEQTLRTLAAIERQSLRMVRLINDLLDVARFESGTIPIDPAPGDLRERVTAAGQRHSAHATVNVQVPDQAVSAPLDADRVDQVLDNLIANAARHTRSGTSVDIALAVEAHEAIVRVIDHGAGIGPDERARLFTPFHQTPRSRTYGGTGLGLHISRRIAEAHGGRLWLETTGPDGSIFAFALPLER